MPKAGFFRKLGLFVAEEFLDPEACTELRCGINRSQFEQGTVLGEDDHAAGVVEETVRVVSRAHVTAAIQRSLQSRLKALLPDLETHFGVWISDFEGPEFLVYGPGSFYTPHQDASPDAPTESRRVSVVLFLNAESNQPSQDCYCGGSLTFHGLMNGPWEKCAFSLEAEGGLLVAFRSSILHEVRPVTAGQRYSVVGWFTGD